MLAGLAIKCNLHDLFTCTYLDILHIRAVKVFHNRVQTLYCTLPNTRGRHSSVSHEIGTRGNDAIRQFIIVNHELNSKLNIGPLNISEFPSRDET